MTKFSGRDLEKSHVTLILRIFSKMWHFKKWDFGRYWKRSLMVLDKRWKKWCTGIDKGWKKWCTGIRQKSTCIIQKSTCIIQKSTGILVKKWKKWSPIKFSSYGTCMPYETSHILKGPSMRILGNCTLFTHCTLFTSHVSHSVLDPILFLCIVYFRPPSLPYSTAVSSTPALYYVGGCLRLQLALM